MPRALETRRPSGPLRFLHAAALATAATAFSATDGAQAKGCSAGTTVVVAAHPEDDFVFMGPDVAADIRAKRCVIAVYLTSADQGGKNHWPRAENAAIAARQVQIGDQSAPARRKRTFAGRLVAVDAVASRVNHMFLRLPEGAAYGVGYKRNKKDSLKKLWRGELSSISTLPDAGRDKRSARATYTKADVVAVLRAIMEQARPDKIRMQNHQAGSDNSAKFDHSDHEYSARFALEAAKGYAAAAALDLATLVVAYRGDETAAYRQNVFGDRLEASLETFAAYSKIDKRACANIDCTSYLEDSTTLSGHPRWLRRQYRLTQKTPLTGAIEIKSLDGRCVDVEDKVQEIGKYLQIATCTGGASQKWLYDPTSDRIATTSGRICVQQAPSMVYDGAPVALASCSGAPQQLVHLRPTGELELGGLCIEAPSSGDGPKLLRRYCTYKPNQIWGYDTPPPPIAPAHQYRADAAGNLCLSVEEPSTYDQFGVVTIRACSDAATQSWRPAPDGSLRAESGKCLQPSSDWPRRFETQGCGIKSDYSGPNRFRWWFGDAFLAIGQSRPADCIEFASATDGAQALARDCSGVAEQRWIDQRR